MMEGIFNGLVLFSGRSDLLAESAGTLEEAAGQSINPNSENCLRYRNIELDDHVSRWAGKLDLNEFSLIVTVGQEEANWLRERTDKEIVVWDIPNPWHADPTKQKMTDYKKTANAIFLKMLQLFHDRFALK